MNYTVIIDFTYETKILYNLEVSYNGMWWNILRRQNSIECIASMLETYGLMV